MLKDVGIDQKLNEKIPLDLPFSDETGKDVTLGQYFGSRPVLLALVYYECPMLCTQVLHGLVGSLEGISFTAGKEFEVVFVSFDPGETPALAADRKQYFLRRYGHPEAAPYVHFLTGRETSITALTSAVGFRYAYDAQIDQFAHPAAITLLTGEGRVSRYLYGIEFAPRDLKLALVEASEGDRIVVIRSRASATTTTPSRRATGWCHGLRQAGCRLDRGRARRIGVLEPAARTPPARRGPDDRHGYPLDVDFLPLFPPKRLDGGGGDGSALSLHRRRVRVFHRAGHGAGRDLHDQVPAAAAGRGGSRHSRVAGTRADLDVHSVRAVDDHVRVGREGLFDLARPPADAMNLRRRQAVDVEGAAPDRRARDQPDARADRSRGPV
jgi:cytochrome oxidase Cu insertion factor (SCO1/SenC/PrrC family)